MRVWAWLLAMALQLMRKKSNLKRTKSKRKKETWLTSIPEVFQHSEWRSKRILRWCVYFSWCLSERSWKLCVYLSQCLPESFDDLDSKEESRVDEAKHVYELWTHFANENKQMIFDFHVLLHFVNDNKYRKMFKMFLFSVALNFKCPFIFERNCNVCK